VEQKRFLQTFFGRQLINIEEKGCPSLNRVKGNRIPYCEAHVKGGACALNNVNFDIFKKWLQNNKVFFYTSFSS